MDIANARVMIRYATKFPTTSLLNLSQYNSIGKASELQSKRWVLVPVGLYANIFVVAVMQPNATNGVATCYLKGRKTTNVRPNSQQSTIIMLQFNSFSES